MGFTVYLLFTAMAFVVAAGIMPAIIHQARKRGVFEENNERKTHTEKVSSFGGIGIIITVAIPILMLMQRDSGHSITAFGLALPLFVISLLDDVYGIGVVLRFLVHAGIGFALYQMGFTILNLEGFALLNAGATMVFTILLINAFNLIDGINGLSAGLGVIACLVFGAVLVAQGKHEMALICFIYAGALLGYLGYNFGKKAKIFMGDNGATVLGFLTAVMAMAMLKDEKPGELSIHLALVFAVVSVPVVDVFKVATMRVLKKRSPFSPDRTHIHHLLTDHLFSHPVACFLLYGWTLLQVCLAWLLPPFFALHTVVALSILPYLIVRAVRSIKHLVQDSPKQTRGRSVVKAIGH